MMPGKASPAVPLNLDSPAHLFAGRSCQQADALAVPGMQDLQTFEFWSRVAEQLQLQVREGLDHIRIQLKPDLLGRLEIRAEHTSAGLIATITTESAVVRESLEKSLHLLYRSFQDVGLKVDRVLVTENPASFSSPTDAGNGGHGNARSGYDGRSFHSPALLPQPAADRPSEAPAPLAPGFSSLPPHSTFHAVA